MRNFEKISHFFCFRLSPAELLALKNIGYFGEDFW